MPPLHLYLFHVPELFHRGGRGVRDDEGLQANTRIAKSLLDFLDGLVELYLGIVRTDVPDAFGGHEDDMLLSVREQPENKVGVEIACLEEANAAALAQIAEQVELSFLEEIGASVVECLEIFHELPLALVQRCGADLDNITLQIQKRLIQVPAEPDRFHAAELPGFQIAFPNRGL